jgi:pilus assembly protein CpaE
MLTFTVLAADPERRDFLKQVIDKACASSGPVVTSFPLPSEGDPLIQQWKQRPPAVLVVDIPPGRGEQSLWAIEALHAELPRTSIFAVGDLYHSQTVVDAMRAGACEFLPHNCKPEDLANAIAVAGPKDGPSMRSGRILTVVNAKGGCGATMVAVNLAVALQKERGKTIIVDLAPLGHAALHLNAKPHFGVEMALRSVQRMDQTFLQGLVTSCDCGIDLLAGMDPTLEAIPNDGVQRMLELLAENYQYVVVDASSRLDPLVRSLCELSDLVLLVADANTLALLWSAARVQRYLAGDRPRYDKVQLVLNRYNHGFPLSDTDAEAATDARVLWKVPSEGIIVGPSIDSGVPVVLKKNSEAGRSLKDLASTVADLLQSPQKLAPIPDTMVPSFASMLSR